MIYVNGGTPEMRSIVRRAAKWMLEELVGSRLAENLTVRLYLIKNLKKKIGQTGDCIWENENVKPREFTVRIDSQRTPWTRIRTLAHELIHVKQWATDEMYDYMGSQHYGKVRFRKRIYSHKMAYRKQPWEVQAYAGEGPLMLKWASETDNRHNIKMRKDF